MHIAAEYGSVKILELLIQYKGDVNAVYSFISQVNDDKLMPLNLAIKNKKEEAIAFLKQHKALEKWNWYTHRLINR